MDLEERQERIARSVRERQRVRAVALSKEFGVSLETIRKDLQDLQEQGRLVRVHGGAQANPSGQESAYDRRRGVNMDAKTEIARTVAQDLRDGQTVYLDYGTSTYAVASELMASQLNLTVVTNALPIALLLAEHPSIETILPGGMLRKNENSLYGPLAEKALSELFMDVGFFGCAGIQASAGITNYHPLEVATSQTALAHCDTAVVLADASKIGRRAPHRMAGLEQVDLLVSDQPVGQDLEIALENSDVSTVITERQP